MAQGGLHKIGRNARAHTLRRRRLAALLTVLGIVCTAVGVFNANALPITSGSVGGFEDDGNLVEQGAVTGNLDWDLTSAPDLVTVTDDSTDTGYAGSSKENEPENFSCNTGGANPGKNNILRAYVNTRITGPVDLNPTTAYLDLAFVRAAGTGDAHINFEFNRNEITNLCPFTGRSAGDILLAFDFPGGGGAASVSAFSWDASLEGGLGNWSEFTLPAGAAAGTTNSGTVPDPIAGGNILARRFGEATVDLVAFDNATPGDLLSCPGLGQVNIRSRSSGESFNSALQDRLPQTDVNLSTCGSITVLKQDQNGDPLGGAVFGLFDNSAGSGSPLDTCTTSVVDGLCTFSNVSPGTYWVKEISAPTGYAIDETTTREVTVANFQDVDLTGDPFTNTFQQGFVEINKVLHDSEGDVVVPSDNSVLAGTTFVVYKDDNPANGELDSGEEVTLVGGGAATCTITSGSSCVVGPLAEGDYRVAETVEPPNSSSAGDVDFSIVNGNEQEAVEVDYVNILSDINITLDKDADSPVNVGDTITYTFDVTTTGPDLHDVTLEETVAVCDSDPVFVSGDDGDDAILEPGETWHYTCDHVVLNSDPDTINNTAKVTGTDEYGRTTDHSDSVAVDVLRPDVTVTKVAEDDNIAAGETASYVITATAGGDDGSIARDVSISDNLPPNLTWTENSDSCSILNNTLSCDFGDLDKGDTASVTVSAVTSAANCGDLVNTATVGATNELVAAQGNNSSGPSSIRVACLAITIVKGGPDFVHVGETITYELAVTNSGEDDLVSAVVTDPRCDTGTLDVVDDGNGDTTLAVGETWEYTCTHVVTDTDPDPLPNTATVVGTDDEGRQSTSTDDHSVDVIHPAITIDKTVDVLSAEPGQTVTYSYAVKNTGDVTLTDVKVTDDKLGDIGTIPSLAVGETVTLTRAVTVTGDSPTDNIGTASGTDPLGKVVTATDPARIDIVLPLLLARTGFDVEKWVLVGFALITLGMTMLIAPEAAAAYASGRPSRSLTPGQARVRIRRR